MAVPSETVGRSLIPEKLAGDQRAYSIAEYLAPNLDRMRRLYPDRDLSRYDRTLRALRSDRHKYIWTSDAKPELYDLKEDPGETENLVVARPEVAGEMQAQLDEWLASVGRPPSEEGTAADMDETVVQRLRALGYL